jgi:hypothetical protein
VDVGQEHLDVAAGGEELGDLEDGHKVAAVWPPGRGSAPVDLQVPVLLQRFLHDLWVQHLLQVDLDERHLLLVREVVADLAILRRLLCLL